jgi:hypothetical protein
MTEQKLKFERRYLSFLTTEEQEEIARRIIAFMRECLVIHDYICEPDNPYQTKYKHYHYIFNNTKFGEGYYNRAYEKDGYQVSDSTLFHDFDMGMFERFRYHIRMNGSIIHIRKLIELFGKKVTSFYLENWARKNVAVGLLLNQIVKELNE